MGDGLWPWDALALCRRRALVFCPPPRAPAQQDLPQGHLRLLACGSPLFLPPVGLLSIQSSRSLRPPVAISKTPIQFSCSAVSD